MKNLILRIFATLALLCAFSACSKEENGSENNGSESKKSAGVVGEWVLSSYQTKSISIGSESVDIYLSFGENDFELYQKVGTGRYRKYTGTYTLLKGVLSGRYSDGRDWGSSYEATVSGDTMTLKAGTETSVYRKSSIPPSVKEEAI